MPRITLLGRKWNFSSDDVSVPSLLGFAFQGIWAGLLMPSLWHVSDETSCKESEIIRTGLWGISACFALSSVVNLITFRESLQGSVFEQSKRWAVPHLIVFQSLLTLGELAFVSLCTYYIPKAHESCIEKFIEGDGNSVDSLVVLVATTWCILFVYIVGFLFVFDSMSFLSAEHHIRWLQRQFMRLAPKTELGEHRLMLLMDEVIRKVLRPMLFELPQSDLLCGLVLLGAHQAHQRGDSATVDPLKSKPRGSLKRDLEAQPQPTSPQEVKEVLERMLRYSYYVTAVYGIPMYAYKHMWRCGGCSLCCFSMYGCCCGGKRAREQVTGSPDCCLPHGMHQQSILKEVGLAPEELLYVSHKNEVGGLLPFFISADHSSNTVVICIRGTFSLVDTVTDFLMKLEPLPPMLRHAGIPAEFLGDQDGHVHAGTLLAAVAIVEDIRHRGIVTEAMREAGARGATSVPAKLVVTGHSLGGAVAAVVAMTLRGEFPATTCYAISPPGMACSPEMGAYMQSFVTSLVYNDDWAPRMTLSAGQHALNNLMTALALCKRSKFAVMTGTLLGHRWHPDALFHQELHKVPSESREFLRHCKAGLADAGDHSERDAGGSSDAQAIQFIQGTEVATALPGRVLHLSLRSESTEPSQTTYQSLSTTESITNTDVLISTMFKACWIESEALLERGLVISKPMLTDHFPDKITKALEGAVHAMDKDPRHAVEPAICGQDAGDVLTRA
ncbi:hypothetical protein CYMTET_9583 [Cymbomonas tetramitiformis]|uniref:sn-1-specific diacylglycerol lipase n=1 Tax=Cymbomonas tetramitiformis TaxID=36881 RepID=A0AAE0GR67_9CHLO|nr:hypothetical protein CYMTET_9583 [Cymbomonas tetramitiformis]